MRRFLIWTILATTLAGCQSISPAPTYRWDCNDKPFEAGLCDQPTNWRISQLLVER